jgi:hypothetical protein
MAKFAIMRGGAVTGYRELETADHLAHKTDAEKDGGDGGPFVRLVVDPGKPEINPLIETLSTSQKINRDTVEIVYTVTPRDLAEVKADLVARIDRDAERERLKYITAGDGQALEYIYVVMEARAFQADPNGGFPLLQASVDAGEAGTLGEAAALVLSKNAEWLAIGARIRTERLKAKRAIDTANNGRAAHAAYTAIKWGE